MLQDLAIKHRKTYKYEGSKRRRDICSQWSTPHLPLEMITVQIRVTNKNNTRGLIGFFSLFVFANREVFDDILELVKQNQKLRKVSLTVSRQTEMSKKFMVNLSWCCSKLIAFSLEFSKGFLNPQLTAHLNTVLPQMQLLSDLR